MFQGKEDLPDFWCERIWRATPVSAKLRKYSEIKIFIHKIVNSYVICTYIYCQILSIEMERRNHGHTLTNTQQWAVDNCGVTLLLCGSAECLWSCFVCTITLQASGKASAKIREWNVEFGCGIWPYKIKRCVLYLAVLCGALPRKHRRRTICSGHREGNTGKGHGKENRTKTSDSRLY